MNHSTMIQLRFTPSMHEESRRQFQGDDKANEGEAQGITPPFSVVVGFSVGSLDQVVRYQWVRRERSGLLHQAFEVVLLLVGGHLVEVGAHG